MFGLKKVDNKGQAGFAGLVITVGVALIFVSLFLVLTNNFYTLTGQTPAFNSMIWLTVAAVLVIGTIIAATRFGN